MTGTRSEVVSQYCAYQSETWSMKSAEFLYCHCLIINICQGFFLADKQRKYWKKDRAIRHLHQTALQESIRTEGGERLLFALSSQFNTPHGSFPVALERSDSPI